MIDYPFTILALAPFSNAGKFFRLVQADIHTLDHAMAEIGVSLSIETSRELCHHGAIDLQFNTIKDFKPREMVKHTPYLQELTGTMEYIDGAVKSGQSAARIAEEIRRRLPGLDLDLTIGPSASRPRQATDSVVDDLLSMVSTPDSPAAAVSGGTQGPAGWRAQVEKHLAKVLDHIFANEKFRLMESAWRGAAALVRMGNIRDNEIVKLQLAAANPDDLGQSLDGLLEQLIEETPNLILLDFPFDNTPRSIELLNKIAAFTDTLLTPAAIQVVPQFFNLDNWQQLGKMQYLKHYLEDPVYAKFRTLREHPGADWLAATCNSFLVRSPYGPDNPARPVAFVERSPLWISPVWALGTLIVRSMAKYGWPTRFTDYRHLNLEGLALAEMDDGRPLPTETAFSEDRIMQFVESGFTPLTCIIGKDTAIIPKQATLAGGSLAFQLFFNRLFSWIFRLKEMGQGADPGATLEKAIAALFRDSGHEPPQDLKIEAGQTDENGRLPLNIGFTPPATILASSDRLEFTLNW
ncbi:MAG: type VI secretion system contractile sheath large subunit [Desulfobulbaceae bacterium]|nr:type VI secretion system contractile sheath large subunit [Desulfobulbaceae bacterium]